MKDAEDFLRYVKFEAINYGYLFAHLFMAIYILVLHSSTYTSMLNAFVIVILVWRVFDIIELHYIEAYDEDIRVIIAKNVFIMLTLLIVTVLFILDKDKLYTNN